METQQLHRGRLIDHLQLVTPDLEASRRFYGAVLEALGVPINAESGFVVASATRALVVVRSTMEAVL